MIRRRGQGRGGDRSSGLPPFALPVATGLGVLLLALFLFVEEFGPGHPPPPPKGLLLGHESMLVFFKGEPLVKQWAALPAGRWSDFGSEPGSICTPLGRGVWYLRGTVGITQEAFPLLIPWELCLVPETSTVLYLRVGRKSEGDFAAALRRAGYDASQEGATHAPR